MGSLEFRILGPFEVLRDGNPIELGPVRQRALLALLLINHGEILSTDRLLDELWGDSPPATAAHVLQVYVSNLRKALEPDREPGSAGTVLVTRRPGYVLDVPAEALDATQFESLAAGGRAQLPEEPAAAADMLRQALGLWRGPALADFVYEPFAERQAGRLEEQRLSALEDRIEADLALGRHTGLVGELEALVDSHPFRERLWGHLMVALYRSDRQGDALRAYERVKTVLADELGLDPGPRLRQLHEAVLRQDLDLHGGRSAAATQVEEESTVDTGAPEEARSSLREERRVVAVLVGDVVRSTALGELIDVEEYKLVMDGATDRMVAAVEAFGGTVIGRPGDGVVAVFGAPEASEDDAERCVQAGLRLAADLRAYGDEVAASWGVDPLNFRVGIDAGTVIVGPTRVGDATTYGALGDPVNTAARLQSAAEPGSVLVADSVRKLVDPLFEWGPTQQLQLSGKQAMVHASEARRRRPVPRRQRGIGGLETALVGRDLEFAVAAEALEGVREGRGGVLVLAGEPGVGKTRLLSELRRLAEGAGTRWLEGRCVSYAHARAYWPVAELIRDWAGVSATHTDLRARVALRRATQALFGDRSPDVFRLLALILGLAVDGRDSDRVEPTLAESTQADIVDAVRRVLEGLTEQGPVVAVVEDVHWADPSSLQLLEHLLPATDRSAVLLVLVMRPERDHPAWRLREVAERRVGHRMRVLMLAPLTGDAPGHLLDALIGPDTLPVDVRARLLDAAEGNPFFLEELVRSLVDSGALARTEGGWRYEPGGPLEIPASVEKVILSRVDRLSPDRRDILEAASVLGRQFTLPLLEAVSGRNPAPAVPDLLRMELLRESQRWPQPAFRFKHALSQEAVYRTLVPARRRDLHRRAAEALEGADDQASEGYGDLARHWEEAGEPVKAIRYHRLAANHSASILAHEEALEHYSAGIELTVQAGEDADALALPLKLGRADILFLRGDERAEDEAQQVLEVARSLGDRDTEWRALELLGFVEMYRHGRRHRGSELLEEALTLARQASSPTGEVSLLNRLSIESATRLDFDRAVEQGTRAMEVARRSDDERLLARGIDCLKLVAFYVGDWSHLDRMVDELEDLLRSQQGSPRSHKDLWYVQFALAECAFGLAARGRWDDALARLNEAEELRGRLPALTEDAFFLSLRGWISRGRGAYGEAIDLVRAAAGVELNPQWFVWANACAGAVLTEVGALEEAVPYLERGRVEAERQGIPGQALRCEAHLARTLWELGDHHAAGAPLERALAIAATVRAPEGKTFLYGADGYVAAGDVLARRGDISAARELLEPLLRAALSSSYHEAVADCCLVLARSAEGDEQETLLRQAHEAARAGGLPRVQWQAHAVAAEVSRHDRPADAEEHLRRAEELVRHLASSLDDLAVRERYLTRAAGILHTASS